MKTAVIDAVIYLLELPGLHVDVDPSVLDPATAPHVTSRLFALSISAKISLRHRLTPACELNPDATTTHAAKSERKRIGESARKQ